MDRNVINIADHRLPAFLTRKPAWKRLPAEPMGFWERWALKISEITRRRSIREGVANLKQYQHQRWVVVFFHADGREYNQSDPVNVEFMYNDGQPGVTESLTMFHLDPEQGKMPFNNLISGPDEESNQVGRLYAKDGQYVWLRRQIR